MMPALSAVHSSAPQKGSVSAAAARLPQKTFCTGFTSGSARMKTFIAPLQTPDSRARTFPSIRPEASPS